MATRLGERIDRRVKWLGQTRENEKEICSELEELNWSSHRVPLKVPFASVFVLLVLHLKFIFSHHDIRFHSSPFDVWLNKFSVYSDREAGVSLAASTGWSIDGLVELASQRIQPVWEWLTTAKSDQSIKLVSLEIGVTRIFANGATVRYEFPGSIKTTLAVVWCAIVKTLRPNLIYVQFPNLSSPRESVGGSVGGRWNSGQPVQVRLNCANTWFCWGPNGSQVKSSQAIVDSTHSQLNLMPEASIDCHTILIHLIFKRIPPGIITFVLLPLRCQWKLHLIANKCQSNRTMIHIYIIMSIVLISS